MPESPDFYDLFFPVLSFCLTIISPACIALWVIYKVLRDPTLYDAKKEPPEVPQRPRK